MITIFSKSKFEGTTDEVIDWLKYYQASFQRLNGTTDLPLWSAFNNEGPRQFLSDSKVCWFRRWLDDDYLEEFFNETEFAFSNRQTIQNHLQREINLLSAELWRSLSNKIWITKPSEVSLKKLEVLDAAFREGILIPPTIITTSKERLKEFKNRYGRIITKTIGDIPSFMSNGTSYIMRTTEVTSEIIQSYIPDSFFPSLFQGLIEKEFEVRTFFLFERFYSMAIFSQNDKQTEIDFRNYNQVKPNRTVPFSFPEDFQRKLKNLVRALNLTSGSIDIIKERHTGNYFLLEINPVGQIGMTSYPCNYYIEREIARELISHDK